MERWTDLFPFLEVNPPPGSLLHGLVSDGPASAQERELALAVHGAPKTELHLHLDGATPASFWQQRGHEVSPPGGGFSNFGGFLAAYMARTRLVTSPRVTSDQVVCLAAQLDTQNITHCEFHLSPADYDHWRRAHTEYGTLLSAQDMLLGALEGMDRAQTAYPRVHLALVVDLLWTLPESAHRELLRALEQVLSQGVSRDQAGRHRIVAVGLGGAERPRDLPALARVLREARELGLALDLHSGETACWETHRCHVETLRPERISHGLADIRHALQVPLTICPLSNLLTNTFPGPLATHPGKGALASGRRVSLGTDDPALFGTTWALEFLALHRAFGWGYQEFEQLQHNARHMALVQSPSF